MAPSSLIGDFFRYSSTTSSKNSTSLSGGSSERYTDYLKALGNKAGQPLMRVFSEHEIQYETGDREQRTVMGFNLYASSPIKSHDRKGLERQLRFAKLMKRVFDIDILSCPRCNSTKKVISFVTEQPAIRDILLSLKMTTAPPEVSTARVAIEQEIFVYEEAA